MAPLLYDPIEAFELLIAIIIFHITRRLHFFNFTNFRFKSHCKWALRFCKRLYHSTIEDRKIRREAAEKMLFLRSKKHENQRFFGLFFWYQWYQYEVGINVRVWLVGWLEKMGTANTNIDTPSLMHLSHDIFFYKELGSKKVPKIFQFELQIQRSKLTENKVLGFVVLPNQVGYRG